MMQDRPNVSYGDRETALANEILRTVVGSGVHGIAIAGTDDSDEMGIFIEPPEHVYGLAPSLDHHIWRTQPEGARSGPGDTDLVVYSLRKFLRLVIKGHPTMLLPLFAPESDVLVGSALGDDLRAMRELFLSQDAVHRFLGYMHAQHERMLGGGKRNRVPNRPELIERYGWDVKYGSHALRLALQGWEVASVGTLTLPMDEQDREMVLAVKRGEVKLEVVSSEVGMLEKATRMLLEDGKTPLPEVAPVERISKWSVQAHEEHWSREKLT
jgi:uncharacterized protein